MGKKRIPESQYRALGEERGLIYKSGYTGSARDNVLWECCKCGSVSEMRYDNIQSGRGCPKCVRKRVADAQRIPEEQYHGRGKKAGLEYLHGYTGNTADSVCWRWLKCGHEWRACYSRLAQGDMRCPKCNRKKGSDHPRSIPESQYPILAEANGIVYTGGYIGLTHDPVSWLCPVCGNRWKTSYSNIQKGTRCPRCTNMVNGRKASKIQITIAEMLEGEVNYKIGKRYVDIVLLGQHVAIEFDCWYWHGNQVEEDRARAQEIIDEGWSVLAIKGNAKIPTHKQIADAIAALETYGELVLDDWGKGAKLIR